MNFVQTFEKKMLLTMVLTGGNLMPKQTTGTHTTDFNDLYYHEFI